MTMKKFKLHLHGPKTDFCLKMRYFAVNTVFYSTNIVQMHFKAKYLIQIQCPITTPIP